MSANNSLFWKEVKRIKAGVKQCTSPVVDGLSDDKEISDCFRSKLSGLLNSSESISRNSLLAEVSSQIRVDDIDDVKISIELVEHCLKELGLNKSDGTILSSNHFVLASSVIAQPLAELFLRHGHMPAAMRDCVLVPIPKPLKDPSNSDSYRPIALAPNLSKALERCILIKYRSCLITSDLQFGFKQELSTDLCTGVLKNVVSEYRMAVQMFLVAFWMLVYRLLIELIILFSLRCSWIGTFLAQHCAFCSHGTKIKNLLFVGILIFRKPLVLQMVFARAVFSLQFFFQFTLTSYS